MITKLTPRTEVAWVQDPRWPTGDQDRTIRAEDLQYWAYASLKAFPELARLAEMAMENMDDDLEERPMRHSLGQLTSGISHLLAGMKSAIEFGKWEKWYDEREAKAAKAKA